MARRRGVFSILAALLYVTWAVVHAFLVGPTARYEFYWRPPWDPEPFDNTPGWSLGGSTLLAFALIGVTSVINLVRGRRASNAPAFVGLAFLFFDAMAYFCAGRNLQVIGFIAIGLIGLLVTAFGKVPGPESGNSSPHLR